MVYQLKKFFHLLLVESCKYVIQFSCNFCFLFLCLTKEINHLKSKKSENRFENPRNIYRLCVVPHVKKLGIGGIKQIILGMDFSRTFVFNPFSIRNSAHKNISSDNNIFFYHFVVFDCFHGKY